MQQRRAKAAAACQLNRRKAQKLIPVRLGSVADNIDSRKVTMNNLCAAFLLLAALVFLMFGAAQAETIHFDSDSIGSLPSGWSSAMTHSGGLARWEIVRNDTAPSKPNVLAQLSSDSTRGRYPLAVFNKVSCKNGDLRVKLKPVSGEVDASGGLVWRYLDENNPAFPV